MKHLKQKQSTKKQVKQAIELVKSINEKYRTMMKKLAHE